MTSEKIIWLKLKVVFWTFVLAGVLLLVSLFITCAKADYQLYVLDLDKPYDDGTYQTIHTERFIAKSDCDKQGEKFRDFAGYFGGRAGWVCPNI